MTNQSHPKISVVMVDGSFRERFHLLDSLCDQTLPAEAFEVIWVEYYARLKPELRNKIEQRDNFKALTLGREGVYHSSYCFNAGIQEASGELLVVPDADVMVQRDFLETVWKEHQDSEKLVMYVHRLDEPKHAHRDGAGLEDIRSTCVLRHPSNYGGCLTVRRKWMMKINGYEQHPIFGTGLHANGLDVYTRLKNAGLHIMWHPDLRLYHPWHPLTKAWAVSYRLQKLIINHRAVSKDVLPYQGIDPSLDRPVPSELRDRLHVTRRPLRVLLYRMYSNLRRRFG